MIPDSRNANVTPEYLTSLVKKTGLTQRQIAALLGQDERSIRRWMRGDRKPPYLVQYALEQLADESEFTRALVQKTAKNI